MNCAVWIGKLHLLILEILTYVKLPRSIYEIDYLSLWVNSFSYLKSLAKENAEVAGGARYLSPHESLQIVDSISRSRISVVITVLISRFILISSILPICEKRFIIKELSNCTLICLITSVSQHMRA